MTPSNYTHDGTTPTAVASVITGDSSMQLELDRYVGSISE